VTVRLPRQTVKRVFPKRLHPWLLRTYLRAARPAYAGHEVNCPCCGSSFRAFLPYRIGRSVDRICPGCGALARHRLLLLFLQQRTNLFRDELSILHVAPEASIQKILRAKPELDYVSVDLDSPLATEHMDLTDLRFADERFDAIICLHVLEHIADDRKAMSELCRVLRRGGWAILEVPMVLERETEEDPSISSPRERERRFGQPDHVRRYGRDFLDRLAAAGFSVSLDQYPVNLTEELIAVHGLPRSKRGMVVCLKPDNSGVTA
jgi:SAM-dependent methyltransferase